jgi:hypothetical protein
LYEDFNSGKPVTINGKSLMVERSQIFQIDGLHLTTKGLTYLFLIMLDDMVKTGAIADSDRLVRNPEDLLKKLGSRN